MYLHVNWYLVLKHQKDCMYTKYIECWHVSGFLLTTQTQLNFSNWKTVYVHAAF